MYKNCLMITALSMWSRVLFYPLGEWSDRSHQLNATSCSQHNGLLEPKRCQIFLPLALWHIVAQRVLQLKLRLSPIYGAKVICSYLVLLIKFMMRRPLSRGSVTQKASGYTINSKSAKPTTRKVWPQTYVFRLNSKYSRAYPEMIDCFQTFS